MKLSTDKTAIRPLNTNCNLPEVYSYFWKYSIIVFVAAQAPCEPRRTPGCRSQPAPGRSFIEQIQHEPGSASPGNCGPHTGHNSFRAVSNFNKKYFDARIRKLNWHFAILTPPPQVLVTRLSAGIPFFVTLDVAARVWVWGGDTANLPSQATNRFPAIYTQTQPSFYPGRVLLIVHKNCLSSSAWARPCLLTNKYWDVKPELTVTAGLLWRWASWLEVENFSKLTKCTNWMENKLVISS